MNICPKCGGPAKHSAPDGDFKHDDSALKVARAERDDEIERRQAVSLSLEAAEAEVSRLKAALEIAYAQCLQDEDENCALTAKAEKLKEALTTISEGTRDGQHCALIARRALEGK